MKWTVTFEKFNQLKHDVNRKQSAKKFNTKREAIAYLRTMGFVGVFEMPQFTPFYKADKLPGWLTLRDGHGFYAYIKKN